jgi:hypothetical protein
VQTEGLWEARLQGCGAEFQGDEGLQWTAAAQGEEDMGETVEALELW